METPMYIISKHRVNPIQFIISESGFPNSTWLVILTAPITTGTMSGYNNMGSMISRVFRFDDKEDNKVPMEQNPSVPINITNNKGSR